MCVYDRCVHVPTSILNLSQCDLVFLISHYIHLLSLQPPHLFPLQDQRPDMNSGDSQQMVTPRLEKKKRCVSRDNLLKQAEKLMDELAANKALLEIHYQDEVNWGEGRWNGA